MSVETPQEPVKINQKKHSVWANSFQLEHFQTEKQFATFVQMGMHAFHF